MTAPTKPRVVASVEARMGSSRLPGKVLSDIEGRRAVLRLLDRLRRAATLDAIVLAILKPIGNIWSIETIANLSKSLKRMGKKLSFVGPWTALYDFDLIAHTLDKS